MKKYLYEVYSVIILVILVSLISVIIYFLKQLSDNQTFNVFYFVLVGTYILFSLILQIVTGSIKNKVIIHIIDIITFPFNIIFTILILLLPLFALSLFYSIYSIISITFSIIIYLLLKYFNLISDTNELRVYIILTLSVSISVIINFPIKRLTQKIVYLLTKNYSQAKNANFDKLSNYVASESNTRFLIYAGYAILLILINVSKLDNTTLFDSSSYDIAILQSFVTFIAFDRAYLLLQQIKFRPSQLLSLIIDSVKQITTFTHEKNEEK